MIDGDILVEAAAEDLESPEGFWACQFRFIGEKCLDWEVYESDGRGRALNSTCVVEQPAKFSVACIVYFQESLHDLGEASLYIDGKDFRELPQPFPDERQGGLCLQPEALAFSYSLIVPHKCRDRVEEHGPSGSTAGLFDGVLNSFYPTASEDWNALVASTTAAFSSAANCTVATAASEYERIEPDVKPHGLKHAR